MSAYTIVAPLVVSMALWLTPLHWSAYGTADAVFRGGTVAQLSRAAYDAGGTRVWFQDQSNGRWHLTGPEDWASPFILPETAVVVVR